MKARGQIAFICLKKKKDRIAVCVVRNRARQSWATVRRSTSPSRTAWTGSWTTSPKTTRRLRSAFRGTRPSSVYKRTRIRRRERSEWNGFERRGLGLFFFFLKKEKDHLKFVHEWMTVQNNEQQGGVLWPGYRPKLELFVHQCREPPIKTPKPKNPACHAL